MLVKTDGIVLKQIPFSDTSIIVKIFTREYGLVSFLVKGAKSKKNPKASILKPINQVYISFYQKDNKGLQQIKECQLLFAPDAQLFGIYKSAVAMVIIEMLNKTIVDELYADNLKYDFIHYSFEYLKGNSLQSNFYLSFLYQYSIILGIEIPQMTFQSSRIVDGLSDYTHNASLSISKVERKKIFQLIENHYLENLTNYKSLKSINILEEIFL